MDIKIKGVITRICDLNTTGKGVAIRQVFFKKSNGDYFYPTALGKNINLLDNIRPGDEVELHCEIKGAMEKFNNVVIQEILKLN